MSDTSEQLHEALAALNVAQRAVIEAALNRMQAMISAEQDRRQALEARLAEVERQQAREQGA